MLRIVVYTSEPSSGAARYVKELTCALVQTGADVALFCPPTFDYLGEVRQAGARVILSGSRGVGRAGFIARVARNLRYFAVTAIRQMSAIERGDVVHFQFPLYLPAGILFFALARFRQCPIVFTAHDPKPHKWLLPKGFRWIEQQAASLAYRMSARIVVHNEAGKQVLTREFRQNPQKIVIIPHGPLGLSAQPPAAPSGLTRLLVFGSIRENKGVHLAVQAIQAINAGGLARVGLTIAGEVANAREQTYWAQCKAAIAHSPTGIEVIERYIPENEAGDLIGLHHAVLLPYTNFTSESGVAALALANGRPILATRAGGLGELMEECNCGIPIEEASVAGVQAAVHAALLSGHDALQKMGEAGAALLRSDRSWTKIGAKTLAAYAEAAEDRRGSQKGLPARAAGEIPQ